MEQHWNSSHNESRKRIEILRYCHICKVTIDTEENLKIHHNSPAHLKKDMLRSIQKLLEKKKLDEIVTLVTEYKERKISKKPLPSINLNED